MLTDSQLKKRDAKRDIGQELLAAVKEMANDRWARKTTFEVLSDGSVRRRGGPPPGVPQLDSAL